MRVVSGCSAEFNGKSINKELISGPDLTNQLIGVLTQQEHNFISDTESMFCHVLVVDEHKTFLGFSWCKDGDLNTKPVDYEINCHVFGRVSSPSCSNYAIKKIWK